MTISYNSGRRIQGTSTDVAPIQGGWKEIARTTTGSALSTISVGSIPDKRYYMVLTNIVGKTSDGVNWQTRMGNGSIDTGSNYSMRYSLNGGSDSASSGSDSIQAGTNPTDLPQFNVAYIANLAGKEKLYMSHDVNQETAGAGNAPKRGEYTGKYFGNLSNALDTIGATTGSSSYPLNSGSEIVVLGWDPDDTHTTNFWEQLATDSGAGSTLDTGTITAKKYLWVQCYCKPSSSTGLTANFNSDTSGNYAIRESINGGTDATNIQQGSSDNLTGTSTGGLFFNMFIINIAGKEKLWISHGQENTAGAGTAGDRKEMVGKWANTSNSITKIVCNANFGATSELRVWGSD